MDRISALRNIEDALSEYEAGERSLAGLEREVRGILRTYASSFDDGLSVWQARGPAVDGLTVVAADRDAARERVADLVDDPGTYDVRRRE